MGRETNTGDIFFFSSLTIFLIPYFFSFFTSTQANLYANPTRVRYK